MNPENQPMRRSSLVRSLDAVMNTKKGVALTFSLPFVLPASVNELWPGSPLVTIVAYAVLSTPLVLWFVLSACSTELAAACEFVEDCTGLKPVEYEPWVPRDPAPPLLAEFYRRLASFNLHKQNCLASFFWNLVVISFFLSDVAS